MTRRVRQIYTPEFKQQMVDLYQVGKPRAQIIKEYNSKHCLDYAQLQESLGSICLLTANISQAKTHFKKALKIYEDIWADEPELIEEKYQAIQELYPQAGIALAKSILLTKH